MWFKIIAKIMYFYSLTIIQFSFSDYYRLIHMYSHFGCFKSPRISCFRKLGVSLAAYETSTIKWIYPIVIISVIYISVYTKQPITCIYTRFINFATRLEKNDSKYPKWLCIFSIYYCPTLQHVEMLLSEWTWIWNFF